MQTIKIICDCRWLVFQLMFTVLEPDEPTKRYWQMGQQPNCFCVPISSTWVRGGIYIIICFQGVLHWMTGRFSLFVSYISLLATTVFPFASLPHHFTNALGPGGQLPTSSLLPLSEMVFWGSPCNGLFQKSISTAMRIAEPHLCRTGSSSSARSRRSVAWEPSFESRRKKMICPARVWFGTRVCHPLGWWWRHGQSAWCHAPHSSANPWGPCRGCWPGAERCLLHLLCHFPPGAGKSMQLGTRYNIDLIVSYLFDWPVRNSLEHWTPLEKWHNEPQPGLCRTWWKMGCPWLQIDHRHQAWASHSPLLPILCPSRSQWPPAQGFNYSFSNRLYVTSAMSKQLFCVDHENIIALGGAICTGRMWKQQFRSIYIYIYSVNCWSINVYVNHAAFKNTFHAIIAHAGRRT